MVLVPRSSGLDKHLLIDVANIDPTAHAHKYDLFKGGVSWAATCYEKRKWDRYPDIDSSRYVFMPFILETHGGASRVAINFCKELDQRRLNKTCLSSGENSSKVELMEGLNIEVQKFNSTAILERTPPSDTLTIATDIRHELAMKKEKEEALKRIRDGTLRPMRIFSFDANSDNEGCRKPKSAQKLHTLPVLPKDDEPPDPLPDREPDPDTDPDLSLGHPSADTRRKRRIIGGKRLKPIKLKNQQPDCESYPLFGDKNMAAKSISNLSCNLSRVNGRIIAVTGNPELVESTVGAGGEASDCLLAGATR